MGYLRTGLDFINLFSRALSLSLSLSLSHTHKFLFSYAIQDTVYLERPGAVGTVSYQFQIAQL